MRTIRKQGYINDEGSMPRESTTLKCFNVTLSYGTVAVEYKRNENMLWKSR